MFALLEHNTGDGVHWDFVIEVPGRELLPTWRLLENPLATAGEIVAQRIADHKPHFLDYEGKLSGTLGRVRRLDRGAAAVTRFEQDQLVAQLKGNTLRGRIEIAVGADGGVRFRRIEDSTTER